MSMTFHTFESRDAIAPVAADMLATAVIGDIDSRGRASLMLSGGSTPGATFQRLSHFDLPWDKVDIGLVDDRWVDQDNAGSNGALLRRTLLQNKAAQAHFVPMKTAQATPQAAQADVETAYGAFHYPLSAVVLGMGLDGHTASWFPQADGLDAAINPNNLSRVQAVTAQKSAVTGDYLDRMTLTLSAVATAKTAVLLLTGADKRAVFDTAVQNPDSTLPISHAITALGDRLTVLYAD